jgi:hypothetical protein
MIWHNIYISEIVEFVSSKEQIDEEWIQDVDKKVTQIGGKTVVSATREGVHDVASFHRSARGKVERGIYNTKLVHRLQCGYISGGVGG